MEIDGEIEEFWRLARRFEVANERYIAAVDASQASLAPPSGPLLEAFGDEWPTMGRNYLPIHLAYRRYRDGERESIVALAEEWFAAHEARDEAAVVMQLATDLTVIEEGRDCHAEALLSKPCCSVGEVLARAEIVDHLAWPCALDKLHQDILEVGGLPAPSPLDQRMDRRCAPPAGVGVWGQRHRAWYSLSWLQHRAGRSVELVEEAYAAARPSPPDVLLAEFPGGGRDLMAPDLFTPRDAPVLVDFLRLSAEEARAFVAAWQTWSTECSKWRRRLGVNSARRTQALASRAATAAYSRLVTTPIDGGLPQFAMLVEAAAWFDHPMLWGHLALRAREAVGG